MESGLYNNVPKSKIETDQDINNRIFKQVLRMLASEIENFKASSFGEGEIPSLRTKVESQLKNIREL